tara:strand:+ start:364 stop:4224 length:3861 start_codon:yes stop_codon:yes gene_type:complete
MAQTKKLVQGQPSYNDLSQYNFFTELGEELNPEGMITTDYWELVSTAGSANDIQILDGEAIWLASGEFGSLRLKEHLEPGNTYQLTVNVVSNDGGKLSVYRAPNTGNNPNIFSEGDIGLQTLIFSVNENNRLQIFNDEKISNITIDYISLKKFIGDSTVGNYKDSTGLPKNNDKFQSKDLYTNIVGSDLNNAIIERNLKFENNSFIQVNKCYVSKVQDKKTGNNLVEVWMFSENSYPGYNFDTANYTSIYQKLQSKHKILLHTRPQLQHPTDFGQIPGLDNEIIIQELNNNPIVLESFTGNQSSYDVGPDAGGAFTLRGNVGSTIIIDETTYNPIYFCFRLRGDETSGQGTDVRKRRFQVYKINNLDLFNVDSAGGVTGKTTFFENVPKVNDVQGDGGGSGDEAPCWKIFANDFQVTINTQEAGVNGWASGSSVITDDEKTYQKYFEDVDPSFKFKNSLSGENLIDFLYISPNRTLDNGDPAGPTNDKTNIFPDYFAKTLIGVADKSNNIRTEVDLQSYYDDIQVSLKTSAPAKVGITLSIINPNDESKIPMDYFYFIINWDDKDNKIKTLEDWQNTRPTNALDILELQDENLYQPKSNIGYNPPPPEMILTEEFGELNPYELLINEPSTETEELFNEALEDRVEVFSLSFIDYSEDKFKKIMEDKYPFIEPGSIVIQTKGGGQFQEGSVYYDNTIQKYKKTELPGNSLDGLYAQLNKTLGYVRFTYVSTTADVVPEYGPPFYNTYNTPGIKTIKAIIFSYDEPTGQLGRWKLIKSRFYLDIPLNEYPDFSLLGGSDYTTIPWPYTTPVIGGVDDNSKYKISIRDTLSGGNIGDTDIIDEKFLIQDLENDELGKSINQMDLEQVRYFDKSYNISTLLNIDVINNIQGNPIYLENSYLENLPEPEFFEEFDLSGNGQITNEDANIWDNDYARPDIANSVSNIINDVENWNNLPDEELIGQVDVIRFNEQDYYSRAEYWTGETGECVPSPVPGYQAWRGLSSGNSDTLAMLGLEQGELTPKKACEIYFSNCLDGTCVAVPNTDCSWIFVGGNNNFYNDAFDCVAIKPPIETILPPSSQIIIGIVAMYYEAFPGVNFAVGPLQDHYTFPENLEQFTTELGISTLACANVFGGNGSYLGDGDYELTQAFNENLIDSEGKIWKTFNCVSTTAPDINLDQYLNSDYFNSSTQQYYPHTNKDYWNGDINKFPEESSVGQIFINDNQDLNLKQTCKLELNTGEVSNKSIYDSSGNSNKGLIIGDYKVKKQRKGETMRRDSFIKVSKKDTKDGAL